MPPPLPVTLSVSCDAVVQSIAHPGCSHPRHSGAPLAVPIDARQMQSTLGRLFTPAIQSLRKFAYKTEVADLERCRDWLMLSTDAVESREECSKYGLFPHSFLYRLSRHSEVKFAVVVGFARTGDGRHSHRQGAIFARADL